MRQRRFSHADCHYLMIAFDGDDYAFFMMLSDAFRFIFAFRHS